MRKGILIEWFLVRRRKFQLRVSESERRGRDQLESVRRKIWKLTAG